MYRTFILLLVFTLCHPTFAGIAFSDQAPQILRIAYPIFPPFHWQDEKGKMRGMFYEIVTEALERRMKQQARWTDCPWARCQEHLRSGQADAMITVPTKERSTYTRTHSQPFFNKPLHLFTRADHPRYSEIMQIKTIADIKAMGFSVITYSGNGWHRDNIHSLGIKSHESAFLEKVWLMLAEHRGDLVIEWAKGAGPDLQRLGRQDVVVDTGIVLAQMPFHLLIRMGSPHEHLLDQFDLTIKAMIADGTIATILQRYELRP